jgi:preprotein translocase subunit YajC
MARRASSRAISLVRRSAAAHDARLTITPPFSPASRGLDPEERPVFISEAFAQAAPAAQGGAESSLLSMLPLVLMFVVLYFVMIRPQMKRQKEHKTMIEALAKGDEVVTSGGVLGKVSKLGDNFLHVEVANGVELQVQRSAVVQVLPKGTLK